MRGGKRNGAGRRPGTPNKRTEQREQAMQEAATQVGEVLGAVAFEGDAHALLMMIYKDTSKPLDVRLDAAKAAIGYEKPRLAALDANLSGEVGTYTALPIPVEERDPVPEQVNGHASPS